jgi:membrane associated rhomboid family serine protease
VRGVDFDPDSDPRGAPDPELAALGFVPPDPDEPPPVELWSAVGDVPPWGTALLLLAWAAVFTTFAARHEFGLTGAYLAWGANTSGANAFETAWRMLAAKFLHDGAAHVFFNATSMLIFGPAVERVFTRWGFWIVFAFGGAASSFGSLAWRAYRYGSAPGISVGASGAIFALGGALLVSAVRLRHRLAPGRARALGAALAFLLVQALASGFTSLGTDNAGHVSGFAAGAVLGLLLPLSPRLDGPRTGWPVRVLGTLSALALAAALALGVRGGIAYR